jgi:hypothetical protein
VLSAQPQMLGRELTYVYAGILPSLTHMSSYKGSDSLKSYARYVVMVAYPDLAATCVDGRPSGSMIHHHYLLDSTYARKTYPDPRTTPDPSNPGAESLTP